MIDGTQRTLARVSSASATQTPAWAAATISGRASESRSAVARLIGNARSVGRTGAGLSRMPVARASVLGVRSPADAGVVPGPAGGRRAGGKSAARGVGGPTGAVRGAGAGAGAGACTLAGGAVARA